MKPITNNMAQQTAVEYLIKEIKNDVFIHSKSTKEWNIIFKKSKAMEKEQMISAMIYTFNQQNTLPYGMEYLLKRDGMLEDCENYYKETYGK
jgi:hypothetical protein